MSVSAIFDGDVVLVDPTSGEPVPVAQRLYHLTDEAIAAVREHGRGQMVSAFDRSDPNVVFLDEEVMERLCEAARPGDTLSDIILRMAR